VQADVMVAIYSGHVIVDNTWLWRADHTVSGSVENRANPVQHGLVVAGNDVTAYGLAVEHTLADLTQWTGERGRVFFYQSELPYDVTQNQWGDPGYVGYRVGDGVKDHDAYGVAVYHFFRYGPVESKMAISVPAAVESRMHDSLTMWLAGQGTVDHVLNKKGIPTNSTNPLSDPKIGHTGYVC
jgi:hypothetical protein